MADIVDEGDVSDFPTPPRHPEDIRKECNKLGDTFMDFMMENMMDYAELDPKHFAHRTGSTIGFMLGITKMEEINELFKVFKRGFEMGVGNAEEVIEEALDNNNG
jgi:hypothetical protein